VDQLHRNVEAYVHDVVIKTRSHDEFIPDLEEMFNNLCKFRWKLNPTKCVFSVPQGKLLGFIISHRGFEVNPKKITTIIAMDTPHMIKDVYKLTGCMAALNRFILRLGEWGLAFFKLLKRYDRFQWTEEVKQVLQDLKHHLQSPPILTAPQPGENLLLHRRDYSHHQHSNRGGAPRERPCLRCVAASLLHQRSPFLNPRFITR
jgi:hypothetical protein